MIFKARLISKNQKPLLIIKKTPKLTLRSKYLIRFLRLNQDINIDRELYNFNQEFFKLDIGTKVKGYLKLKYQIDYEVDLEKIK